MPAGYGVGGDDNLPFFTPKNQVLNAQPSRNNYDNPRIFLKSILKPLKGLEVAFEYTFDKNMYDYHYYTSSVTFTTIQGGPTPRPRTTTCASTSSSPTTTPSTPTPPTASTWARTTTSR